MAWKRPAGAVLLSGVACLSSCGDGGSHDAVVERDSAGVHIVESAAPAWDEGEEWRLSDEPVVAIGVMDGPEEYQLQRLVGAVRTRDRGIVIADGGANLLRAFASDGTLLWSSGRPGSGPGEFRRLDALFLYADTLYAYDLMQQRISVVDLSGLFLRSFDVAGATGYGYARTLGRLASGDWVLQRTVYPRDEGASLTRASTIFSHLAEGAAVADSFATLPGPEQIAMPVGPVGAYIRRAPFARIASARVAGDEFVYGGSERFELAVYSAAGTLRTLIRRPIEPEPITPADLDLWEREVEATREPYSPTLPPMYHQPISSFDLPDTKAAYGRVLVDRVGNYWVGDYALPGQQPGSWSVFAPDGRWLGKVATPGGFQPTDIGDDYVLGIFRDDFDVEYVRLYELVK